MKSPLRFLALLAGLALAGCGHLEVAPEGDPNRVATGTVNLRMPVELPGDASALVRVVENTGVDSERRVLGEQAIPRAGQAPVKFRVEFRAEDAVMRHGLNIEARISFGGGLRYYNINAYGLNLSNIDTPTIIVVDPVAR